ncbi:hypothetical protein AX774_g5793 [Zancudomyces culisetae]|uniref:Uncharacterized protein n=1 Tax=Zancudomyces culisetae TaxID=1213189 RepID=A0A1R1PIT6_ZANCU|nr:hypothetical protein AX774_g5793 [Zancudomyces culisetae]|eukprot:OMH80762.1 hypothetical protein AX774_g5793 [Zancudomyces culisetae]
MPPPRHCSSLACAPTFSPALPPFPCRCPILLFASYRITSGLRRVEKNTEHIPSTVLASALSFHKSLPS